MKALLLIFLLIVIQLFQERDKEKDALQGSWSQTGGLYKDVDFSTGTYKNHALPKSNLIIAGDSWTIELRNLHGPDPEITKGSFTLSTKTIPKGIDLKDENRISKGIYKLSDNILTICQDPTGKMERPKDFDRCLSNGYALITYKRK